MKTILVMPEKDFDPTKHQSLHAKPLDPNKAIVLFVAFKKKLCLSKDDLRLQRKELE